jgi:hypothetical protein
MKKILTSLVVALAFASSAQGAVVITAVETGGDVVFSYSGTINQGGWTLGPPAGDQFAFIDPDKLVLVGPTPAVPTVQFQSPNDLQGPDNFGTGPETFASSGSGDIFGLFFDGGLMNLPGGYVRNTPISGTSTYGGQSFASLGMAPGSYEWSWSTLPFEAGRDSVTLNVVPIPAAAWLFGSALIGLAGIKRKK